MIPRFDYLGRPPVRIVGARLVRNLDLHHPLPAVKARGPYSNYKLSTDRYAPNKRAHHIRKRLQAAAQKTRRLSKEVARLNRLIASVSCLGIIGVSKRRIRTIDEQLFAVGRKVDRWQRELAELEI